MHPSNRYTPSRWQWIAAVSIGFLLGLALVSVAPVFAHAQTYQPLASTSARTNPITRRADSLAAIPFEGARVREMRAVNRALDNELRKLTADTAQLIARRDSMAAKRYAPRSVEANVEAYLTAIDDSLRIVRGKLSALTFGVDSATMARYLDLVRQDAALVKKSDALHALEDSIAKQLEREPWLFHNAIDTGTASPFRYAPHDAHENGRWAYVLASNPVTVPAKRFQPGSVFTADSVSSKQKGRRLGVVPYIGIMAAATQLARLDHDVGGWDRRAIHFQKDLTHGTAGALIEGLSEVTTKRPVLSLLATCGASHAHEYFQGYYSRQDAWSGCIGAGASFLVHRFFR